MFPSAVAESFGREQGCTLADWERDLPGAVHGHRLAQQGPGQALIQLDHGGTLQLRWQVLPPRQIALVRIPRLQVDFQFERADAQTRSRFMRRFDLFLQRGGG